MTSHVFLSLLSYFAIAWLFIMGTFGTIELLVSVGSHFQEWLRAHRNINAQVPALSTSVEELRKRQSRMEVELEQIQRIRESSRRRRVGTYLIQTEQGSPSRQPASDDAEPGRRVLHNELARCHREVAAVEHQLRSGHPDVQGLCLALMDWSAELRILECERWTSSREATA